MKTVRRILVLATMILAGCHTAHEVAVTSFRVIDAPANFVRKRLDNSDTTTRTTTTTTTVASDSVTPGRTVQLAPNSREPQRRPVTQTQPAPATTPRVTTRSTIAEKPKSPPSPAPHSVAAPPPQYPTAKVVPGKPGYVFSPYDSNGGYVDVNGYPSGSKVKDPYSGKVFVVP